MSRVSLLRYLRMALRSDGRMYVPTRNQMTRKNPSLPTLYSISVPSTLLLMAMDDSMTIINTAKRSSTISTANTSEANFFCRRLRSVNALIMMVVDDIDSIPPRNRLLMWEKFRKWPTINPVAIIPMTIISAVTMAEPPTLSNFLKLNSNPRENRSTTMPSCAQNSILLSVVTEGRYWKCGLARNPATI